MEHICKKHCRGEIVKIFVRDLEAVLVVSCRIMSSMMQNIRDI